MVQRNSSLCTHTVSPVKRNETEPAELIPFETRACFAAHLRRALPFLRRLALLKLDLLQCEQIRVTQR